MSSDAYEYLSGTSNKLYNNSRKRLLGAQFFAEEKFSYITRKPRPVLYICSKCGGYYQRITNNNPWWTLCKHTCDICRSQQIPRLDIEHPLNSLDLDSLHTAVFGFSKDINQESYEKEASNHIQNKSNFDDVSSGEYYGDENCSINSAEEEDLRSPLSNCDKSTSSVDYCFRFEQYISKEDAVKLVILMTHARVCDGSHVSAEVENICRNIKFLMLHLRDCNNKDCQVPWCKGCKLILHHLLHCFCPSVCVICTPTPDLPVVFQQIHNQNINTINGLKKRKRN